MVESENGDGGQSLGSFQHYPAPGRPEQPMPGPPSSVPWLVLGVVITFVVAVVLFIALIRVLPEQ